MSVNSRYVQGGLTFYDGSVDLLKIAISDLGGHKLETTPYSADGALPIRTHTAAIIKAGVCALTIDPPPTTHDGVTITVMATTAHAHTVTATTVGFNAGDAASDVATFAAAIGNNITFTAIRGEWYVVGTPVGVTLG